MLARPSAAHWLGTDAFGRDVLSRIIYGSRTAMLVGFACAFLGATLGAVIGVTSAYFGGRADLLMQRVMDLVLAFPLIILALAVVSILGTGVTNLIAAITIPMIPRAALVARSSALAIREMPYVDAARAAGFSHRRIILRHMLPNVMAVSDHAHRVPRAGNPPRGVALLSRPRGGGADARVGAHAARSRRPVRRVGAVDGDLPRVREQSRGLRVQPLRRLAAPPAPPTPTPAIAGRP